MAHMRGQQEDLALPDRHVVDPPVFGDLQQHVALELVEELLHRIVMEVHALVRAADHHDGHARLLEDQLVADRRLQQMAVSLDPALEVEGPEARVQAHPIIPPQGSSPQAAKASRIVAFSFAVSGSIGRRTAPPTWPSSSCQYFCCACGLPPGRVDLSAWRTGSRLSRTRRASAALPAKARSV